MCACCKVKVTVAQMLLFATSRCILLFVTSPVFFNVLVVRVIGVLPPLRFHCAHQDSHHNKSQHAEHHGQVPDDVPKVLLSQCVV